MAFHNDSFLAVQKSHFHYVYFPKSDGLLKSLGHLSDSPTSSKHWKREQLANYDTNN